MNNDVIIEHYLTQLDRELQALPTGQRAEIITEIRSHILEASEKDPAKNIQIILDGMGTPKDAAMRYLQQKGVKYSAPNRPRNWLRIFALSVVGLFAFAVVSTVFCIWYFSPLIQVDQAKGRVTLFGGAIDVNEATNEIKIGSMKVKDEGGGRVKIGDDFEITGDEPDGNDFQLKLNGAGLSKSAGKQDLAARKVTMIKIPFNTANLEIRSVATKIFEWKCKNLSSSPPKLTVAAGVLTLDLVKVNVAKCELGVPEGLKTEIKGMNGKLDIEKPSSHYDINVTNGKVDINPDPSRVYDFEVSVKNGMQDNFARSTDNHALKVKVDVVNGMVKRDTDSDTDGDNEDDGEEVD